MKIELHRYIETRQMYTFLQALKLDNSADLHQNAKFNTCKNLIGTNPHELAIEIDTSKMHRSLNLQKYTCNFHINER